MTTRFEFLGPNELARLPEPSDPMAAVRVRYTRVLVGEGARSLIDNADVEVRALVVDGDGRLVWPLVLGNPDALNADICSPYTWYVRYVPSMIANRNGAIAGLGASLKALPMAVVLKLGDVDRVVYVNNWLLSTNPSSGLPAQLIPELTSRLTESWPDRAVVFRSINPTVDPESFHGLRAAGYRFVRSRNVYLLDTRNSAYRDHKNVRIDLHELERTSYEVVDEASRIESHARRMVEIHRMLYVTQYVHYNPQFSERFFSSSLSSGVLRYHGLLRNGRLDGFVASLPIGDVLWSILLGYDVTLPRELGLYRLLIAILMRDAGDHRQILNLSSGVGPFKALRGGRPVDEFDAVYDAHLPARRRMAWSALRAASNRRSIGDADAAGT
jgi:hypothetical protein